MPTESTHHDSDQETQSSQHSNQGANSSQPPTYLKLLSRIRQIGAQNTYPAYNRIAIHLLNTALKTPAMPNTPVPTNLPQLPYDHIIHDITNRFQEAILENDVSSQLITYNDLYHKTLHSGPTFIKYDSSNLPETHPANHSIHCQLYYCLHRSAVLPPCHPTQFSTIPFTPCQFQTSQAEQRSLEWKVL